MKRESALNNPLLGRMNALAVCAAWACLAFFIVALAYYKLMAAPDSSVLPLVLMFVAFIVLVITHITLSFFVRCPGRLTAQRFSRPRHGDWSGAVIRWFTGSIVCIHCGNHVAALGGKMRLTSALVAVLLIAMNAHADQFRFTGSTTAGNALIGDTLRQILAIGEAKFRCPTPEKAEAEVLPDSYRPPGGPHAEGNASTVYERWTVTFCGSSRVFLIAFWPATDGGMMFRVQYPFPRDS